jgi:DNA polymerase I-like protein with 3'-5' exonuclease and polymerase domains
MKYCVVDYETEYEKKVFSTSTHGVWNYAGKTEAYLVALATDEWTWVGHPSEAPWDKVLDHEWVSHNRSFDKIVHLRKGFPMPPAWHCSADMCAWLQFPRALKAALQVKFGVALDKSVRDDMSGKKWADVIDKERVRQYALADAVQTLRLWNTFSPRWPERERKLSSMTTDMGIKGIRLDVPLLHQGIETLRQKLHETTKAIPWEGPPTSPKQLAQACRDAGVPPPITTNIKDPRFDAWLDAFEEQVPFVKLVSQFRSVNRLLAGLETMEAMRDGDILHQPLLYCGAAHTGRWSGGVGEKDGSGGLNLQNLNKKPLFGVDQRAILIPREGHLFYVADLAQIEPRVLAVLSGNAPLLEQLHKGLDVYEAHARATKRYAKPEPLKEGDPALRQTIKAEYLGLGYQMGAKRFKDVAATVGLKLTLDQSQAVVDGFRQGNPWVVRLWEKLQRGITTASQIVDGKFVYGDFTITNPYGRSVRYANVKFDPELTENGRQRGWVAQLVEGGVYRRVSGGLLTENCVAGNSEVLTLRGWVRLDAVSKDDLVWDGVEFVRHAGLLAKGTHKTYVLRGVRATPDHRFQSRSGGWLSLESMARSRKNARVPVFDLLDCGPRHQFVVRGGPGLPVLIAHNCTQGTAREVFAESLLQLPEAVLHVHDEVVLEIPEETVQQSTQRALEILTTPPSWMPKLPLASDGHLCKKYEKK